MPKLKQLTCHVEWTPSNTPFREYGICYGDGVVESYIAIPAGSTPFSINLRSDGFIAPGLAAFVFIDGVYQCNRYRGDLQISDKVRMDCLSDTVNFRVRQKEERLPDGGWIGRPWRFEPLNIDNSVNDPTLSSHFRHLGTIHVLVLRCLPDTGLPDYAASGFDLECPTSPESATAIMSDDESLFTRPSHGQTKSRDQTIIPPYAGFDGPGDTPYYNSRQSRRYDQFRPNTSSARDVRSEFRRGSGGISSDDWNQPRRDSDWADVPVRKKSSINRLERDQRTATTTSSHLSCQSALSRRLDTNYVPDIDPFDSASNAPNRARMAQSRISYAPSGTPIVVNINPMLSPEQRVTTSRGPGLLDERRTTAGDAGHGHIGSNRDKGYQEYNLRRRYDDSEKDREYQYGRKEGRRNMKHGNVHPASTPGGFHSRDHQQHDGRDSDWDNYGDTDQGVDNNSPSTGWKPNGESGFLTEDKDEWGASSPQMTQSDDQQWEQDADPLNNNKTEADNEWVQPDTNASSSNNESLLKEKSWQPDAGNVNEGYDWDTSENPNQDTIPEKQSHVDEHSTTIGNGTWNRTVQSSSSGIDDQDPLYRNTADNKDGHGAEPGRIKVQIPCGEAARMLRERPVLWQGNNPLTENAAPSPASRPQQLTPGQNSMVLVSPLATGSDENEPALYTVPLSVARSGLLSHQVQLGSAAEYVHKVGQPTYIDTLESPYAKFTFNYRIQGAIEQLLGIKIERNLDEERRKLESVSKEELIAHILRTEGLSGGNHNIPSNY
ncbi:hypothetical protein DTO166G4_6219 [Paecilomyces variotii]|nr:hypothetical protein DTO166G4_6219 [Paecilomyces variotii]KAJ9233635.1 hypothetical protein DTO166G5_5569 [Paecilomyces variotii]KAJ9249703.1 hypothetical protein DTO207G8_6490 [Paecilomyces variotii]KAJ9256368.1 hypothetical protein DTO195F2_5944 [Paecilomyces variotii]KAJ9348329.1 hypothetical protein DTO027B9_8352 [Paecilomyces variotii]